MKVLITGGAGYIGSHTNRYFSEHGIDTVVVDDLSAGHAEAVLAGRLVRDNFGNRTILHDLMGNEPIDAIVHFAAYADVADSVADPGKYYRNNVSGMINLLNCMVAHKIKYFIYSSSAATFGEPKYIPIDEEHPQQPINPYGMSKLIGEKLLEDYERAYGIRYCALRYFNASGASRDGLIGESHTPEHHLIPLIQRAELNEDYRLKVFGCDYPTRDGSCLRDYIHVEDLAEAHYLGMKYIMEHNCSECFNMGSNTGFTVLELIHEFERLVGEPINYEITGRRVGDPASLLASNQKAKRLLGWEPKRSGIREILLDAWNWEKKRRY
jgi:UDP-glucose-4-epimerase